VVLHNAHGIAGVLDGIVRLSFNEDRRRWNALGSGRARHDLSFKNVLACGSAGNDQAWSDASLVLAYSFDHTGKLQRCRIAVAISRRAQEDDGVKAGERCV